MTVETHFILDPLERCGQMIWPHQCSLTNCPKDDPDHIHECYANDFDWREGDFVEYRLGRIDIDELLTRALARTARRLYGKVDERKIKNRIALYHNCVRQNEDNGVYLRATTTGLRAVDAHGNPIDTDDGMLIEP